MAKFRNGGREMIFNLFKFKKMIVSLFIISLTASSPLHAFKENTHMMLNQFIALNKLNGFSLDSFLINKLGFMYGINDKVSEVKIFKLIEQGGRYEDNPDNCTYCYRFRNHFHDPLNDRGLTHGWFGESALKFAFLGANEQSFGGYYSWHDVKNYFYIALTAQDETTREENFAKMFRGLGQLMHLLQDMSVPAHARDDAHIIDDNHIPQYETWLVSSGYDNKPNFSIDSINAEFLRLRDCDDLTEFIEFPDIPFKFFNPTVLNNPNSLADVPVANLFDNNRYVESNPNPGLTLGNNIGLSEYTNANFLSPDTISCACFPYPKIPLDDSDIPIRSSICETEIEDPADGEKGKYFSKCKDGEIIDYFVRVTRIQKFIPDSSRICWEHPEYCEEMQAPVFGFTIDDDRVYANYAKLLIPRAVGYSAQLLEYFFRGDLEIFSVPVFYGDEIYAYLLNIKNISQTGESLSNGQFSVVLRYTPEGGNPDGSDDIFVQSSMADSGTLQYGQKANYLFFFNESAPQKDKEFKSAKCTLIFKGTLGNEQDAVIAAPFKRGKLKFIEEWDNDLTGNHLWFHTSQDSNQNYDNGITVNAVSDGILGKENIRYNNNDKERINETFIYLMDLCPYPNLNKYCEHQVDGPNISSEGMRITQNTYVIFKIDDLSINQQPPAPSGFTTAEQYFELEFNAISEGQADYDRHGLEFTQPGQIAHLGSKELAYAFPIGKICVYNIYNLFKSQGIVIPEPFYLQVINLTQKLKDLAAPSSIEHHQHMKVDFISIVEGNDEDETEQQ